MKLTLNISNAFEIVEGMVENTVDQQDMIMLLLQLTRAIHNEVDKQARFGSFSHEEHKIITEIDADLSNAQRSLYILGMVNAGEACDEHSEDIDEGREDAQEEGEE